MYCILSNKPTTHFMKIFLLLLFGNILWTDETQFTQARVLNIQIMHYWSLMNHFWGHPMKHQAQGQQMLGAAFGKLSEGISVPCGFSGRSIDCYRKIFYIEVILQKKLWNSIKLYKNIFLWEEVIKYGYKILLYQILFL